MEIDLADIKLLKAIVKKYGDYAPAYFWELKLEFIGENNELLINGESFEIDELNEEARDVAIEEEGRTPPTEEEWRQIEKHIFEEENKNLYYIG